MLAGGDDAPAADVPADAVIVAEVSPVAPAAISAPVLEASSSTVIEPVVPAAPTAPATYNPYAYLSYLSADKTDGKEQCSLRSEHYPSFWGDRIPCVSDAKVVHISPFSRLNGKEKQSTKQSLNLHDSKMPEQNK